MNLSGSSGRPPIRKRRPLPAGEGSPGGKNEPATGKKVPAGDGSPLGKKAPPHLDQMLLSARKNFLFSTEQVAAFSFVPPLKHGSMCKAT
jgi:hypothetical protein